MLSLYLHIPFCQSLCAYCNFNRGLLDGDLKRRYVTALEREIAEAPAGHPSDAGADTREPDGSLEPPRLVDTVFFGGGTPSLLEPEEVGRILDGCRQAFQILPRAEITLETNPETATPARLAAFRDAGITRISFGVQSFDDEELKRLGRIHSAAKAAEAITAARQTGFESVSFDLMCWLPGQSQASWLATIDKAIALEPQHVSMYLLELYPNAPLKEEMARSGWSQAPDDDAADMYLGGFERLEAAGFEQYEISNAARPGFWSRHNVKYWQGGNWLGFGCGAHSTVAGVRWKNLASTTEYVDRLSGPGAGPVTAVRRDARVLSSSEQVEEALFTGLRLSAGIDIGTFQARYGVDPWSRYGDALKPYVLEQLVWHKGDRFGLTRRGMLVANEILATFV